MTLNSKLNKDQVIVVSIALFFFAVCNVWMRVPFSCLLSFLVYAFLVVCFCNVREKDDSSQ